ncbi:hypothetical protein GCM10027290_61880 [Micromonospora sonneratiae]
MMRVTADRDTATFQPAFVLWASAAALTAVMALPASRSRDAASLVVGLLACAVGTGLAWWAVRRGQRAVATALIASAGLWAGLAGWVATLLLNRVPVVAGAVAALCAALVTAGACRLAGVGRTLAMAVAPVAVAAAVAAGCITAGVDARQPIRVAPVVIVLSLGLLARHSLGAGGLAQATFRLRAAAEPAARSERLITVAEEYLRGGLIGLATVAAGCAAFLIGTGGTPDVALGAGVALLLWTRSRLFEQAGHVLPLRLAAVAALLTGAARLLAALPAWGLMVGLLTLAAVTVWATGSGSGFRWPGRWLRLGELALAAVMAAALAAAVGLLDFDFTTRQAG